MAKGRPCHRGTVLIFGYVYIILSILWLLAYITGVRFVQFSFLQLLFGFFGFIAHLAIGCTAIYALKKDHGGKMKIFGLVVVVVIITQLLTLILTAVIMCMRTYIIDYFLRQDIEQYYAFNTSRDYVELMQTNYNCCGSNNYSDWSNSSSIPFSCCEDLPHCNRYYQHGCTEKIGDSILKLAIVLAVPYICIIIFHIFTARFAFALAKLFNEPDDVVKPDAQLSRYSIPATISPRRPGIEYTVPIMVF